MPSLARRAFPGLFALLPLHARAAGAPAALGVQDACSNEIGLFCAGASSSEETLLRCLRAHKAAALPQCRQALSRYGAPAGGAAQAPRLPPAGAAQAPRPFEPMPGRWEAPSICKEGESEPARGIKVTLRCEYFPVYGLLPEHLGGQISLFGPLVVKQGIGRRANATTAYRIGWQGSFGEKSGGCGLVSSEALVQLTYTYPRWETPANASKETVEKWRSFLDLLKRHEEGHGAIAVRTGGEVLDALKKLTLDRTCKAAKESASLSAESVIERGKKEQAAFDERDGGASFH